MPFGLITTRKARKIAVGAISHEIERVEGMHEAMPPVGPEAMAGDKARLTALRRIRVVVQDAFASKAEIRASK